MVDALTGYPLLHDGTRHIEPRNGVGSFGGSSGAGLLDSTRVLNFTPVSRGTIITSIVFMVPGITTLGPYYISMGRCISAANWRFGCLRDIVIYRHSVAVAVKALKTDFIRQEISDALKAQKKRKERRALRSAGIWNSGGRQD